jgi:hypothetical protein
MMRVPVPRAEGARRDRRNRAAWGWAFGLLLVLGSLWLAVLAIRGRRAGFVWAAVLGALFILGAGFNGASFLNYNEDANSYVMALLFAVAVLCYIVLLALPRSSERQALAA